MTRTRSATVEHGTASYHDNQKYDFDFHGNCDRPEADRSGRLRRRARHEAFIDTVGYGNRDLSDGLTTFWLGSMLTISADEQVQFLDRLRRGELPLSPRSMDLVRECVTQRREPGLIYRGKTGSDRGGKGEPDLGWWVGWIERGDQADVFAITVSGDGTFGPMARSMGERVLVDVAVLPGGSGDVAPR